MRKLIFLIFLFSLAFTLLTGCSGIMNPYSSDFQCPRMENGKSVSVNTAYKESKGGGHYKDLWTEDANNPGKDNKATGEVPSGVTLYQSALFDRLSGLLKQPTSPFVVPPQVMRVLILPYTGKDNELYMQRYVYLFLTSPKWLLNDAISGEGGK
jgi:conjugal transfer pilus assembly protein TraV